MQKGFSFIELLAALTIIAIFISIAAPGMAKLYIKSSVDAQARTFLRMLHKARAETVINDVNATFCGVNANDQCQKGISEQFIVFVDDNENRQLDDNERLIYQLEREFDGEVFVSAANGNYISFQISGATTQYGHILLCPSRHTKLALRKISLNPGGRAYLVRNTPAKREALAADCAAL